MANTNSDIVTAQAAAAVSYPTTELDVFGTVLYTQVKVTMPAAVADGDTLTLLPASLCPVGAYLVPQLSSVYAVTDPGTSVLFNVGTVADPDKFADELILTQAGSDIMTGTGLAKYQGNVSFAESKVAPAAIATPYKFTDPEAIIATAGTISSASEAVLVFLLAFRVKA
jgi:hypothetical protein